MYKIIGANQVEYGPITADQLRQWIAEGRADANTRVKPEGTEDWKPLSAYPEFAPSLNPIPTISGAASPGVLMGVQPTRTNPMALTGMIMGILSITVGWACCSGPIFSTLGIVFSGIGLSQIKKNPTVETGRGMAITGLVLSILGLVVTILLVLFFGFASVLSDAMKK
jgi:Domain of unknown function (DUF4190)/GYF domain 2